MNAQARLKHLLEDSSNQIIRRNKSDSYVFNVNITPELAEKLLDFNTNNRPLNKSHANKLADDMTNGKWNMYIDTPFVFINAIGFECQHRLTAVVKSGATLYNSLVTVFQNVPDSQHLEMFLTRHKAERSLSFKDCLRMLGFDNEGTAHSLITNIYTHLDRNAVKTNSFRARHLPDFLEVHAKIKIENSVNYAKSLKPKTFPSHLIAFLHYAYINAGWTEDEINEPMGALLNGIGADDPKNSITRIRDAYIKSVGEGRRIHMNYMRSACVRAFNNYLTGNPAGTIPRVFSEAPRPVKPISFDD